MSLFLSNERRADGCSDEGDECLSPQCALLWLRPELLLPNLLEFGRDGRRRVADQGRLSLLINFAVYDILYSRPQQDDVVVVAVVVLAGVEHHVIIVSHFHCLTLRTRAVELGEPRLLHERAERLVVNLLCLRVVKKPGRREFGQRVALELGWIGFCLRARAGGRPWRDVAVRVAVPGALAFECCRQRGHHLRSALNRGEQTRSVTVVNEHQR